MSAYRLSCARRSRGFTLVELMIGMVLGLIVLAAAITVFESNKRTYTATENLNRVQENARVAFELLSRDVRESAGNPCEADLPVYNVLTDTSPWWANFGPGLRGYSGSMATPGVAFGTAPKTRVAGTDAVDLKTSVSDGVTVVAHNPTSAVLNVNTIHHHFEPGDIAMLCDFAQAAIFQVSGASSGVNNVIVHNTGSGSLNCSKGLGMGIPVNCTNPGNSYAYGCFRGEWQSPTCKDKKEWPATLSKLRATRWFIGNKPGGGRSLFQATLRSTGGQPKVDVDEIAEGVENMRLRYLVRGTKDYVEASAVSAADWAAGNVVSMSVELTLVSNDAIGADGKPLQRTLAHTVAIRNRAP